MTHKKAFIISWSALILTIPWWFSDISGEWFGLPGWACYAMVSAIIYSIILFFVIQKSWHPDNNES
tara:strand:- start:1313 stop:1510 length:198 start_codon:yes stop_codon:yes gene_type:complete